MLFNHLKFSKLGIVSIILIFVIALITVVSAGIYIQKSSINESSQNKSAISQSQAATSSAITQEVKEDSKNSSLGFIDQIISAFNVFKPQLQEPKATSTPSPLATNYILPTPNVTQVRTFSPVPSPLATTGISPSPTAVSSGEYILLHSEGTCSSDSNCQWAGEGCGGGHGICTNQPKKYEGMATTCDVNEEFPANQGYTCGCIETLGKCGWVK